MTERKTNQKQANGQVKIFTIPFDLAANLDLETTIEIAKSLFKQTKYQETINTCHQILADNSNDIDALKLIAKSFLAIRKIEDARLNLLKVLNIKPDDYESIKDLGNTYQAIGKSNTAKNYYQKAIEINNSYAPALTNLGIIELNTGSKQKALSLLIKATKCDPRLAPAWGNLANAYVQLGKTHDAEIACSKLIKLNPSLFSSHFLLGTILIEQKKLKEAEQSLRKTIELKPDLAEAHSNLGIILRDLGKLKEAEQSLRKTIELKPDLAKAHSNLGIILKDLGKLKEAEISQRKAIEIKPDSAKAHSNLGNILKDLGKLKEAEISQRKAIEIEPDFAEAHCNLGVILNELGKLKEAEISQRKAIEINPAYEEANHNLSLILLRSNNFQEGFKRYESRWKVRGNNKPFITSKPEWTPMKRGKVLLWAEQGIGDEILFASLIPELVNKVDQLIVQVDARLIPLFQRSFDKQISYIPKNQIVEEEKYDFQISMGSMIKYFRDDKESFNKGKKKYLKVNERKTTIFRDKILKDSKKNKIIGISWISKSATHKHKSITHYKDKSMTLEKFVLSIYSSNLCFLNLQYGNTKDEINKIKTNYNIDIYDLKEVDNFNNLDDLAALINACDMVVSIENITFALAGALGIDSKILLKRNCLWFNGNKDLESYWFANQHLFRQAITGEWEKALKQIKKELEIFK